MKPKLVTCEFCNGVQKRERHTEWIVFSHVADFREKIAFTLTSRFAKGF